MKKKILLLLALIVVLGVLAVPQAQAAGTHGADHCVCFGAEHIADHAGCETVTWRPATEAYSGSNTISFTSSGAYYLTQEENRSIVVASGVEISLCLNGNTICADRTVSVSENGTLNICDCAGEGKIGTTWVSKENEKSRGWAVKVEKGICNLYSGTISGKGFERGQQARSLYVIDGTVRIYGGQINSGYAVASESFAGRGGNVYMSNSSMQMFAGTITGGNADEHGGNIQAVNSQIRMEGGLITGGSASKHGGNICLFGSALEMSEQAQITNGTAGAKGGNLCLIGVSNGAIAELKGTIAGGVAGTYGGNISVNKGGDEPAELYLLEGCVVSDGVTRAYGDTDGGGGNLHLHGDPCIISLDGAEVIGGESAGKSGGNVYLEDGTFEIKSGTIKDGIAKYNAGNVFVGKAAVLTIKGGTVSGGATNQKDDTGNGGNFYVAGSVTMVGGTVTGGSAHSGGNFQIDEGTMMVAGGTISDGVADAFGGNIMSCGTLTVTGGTITGGSAVKDGGNIAVSGLYSGELVGTVEVKKGQIIDGITENGHGVNLAVVNAGSATITGGEFGGSGDEKKDVSVCIDGVFRGAPELTLSKNAAAGVYLDNSAAYEKLGVRYEPKLNITELDAESAVTLQVAQPKNAATITGDLTGKLIKVDNFGYALSVDEAAGTARLQNVLPIWIGGGVAALLVLAVVLVLVLKKKK